MNLVRRAFLFTGVFGALDALGGPLFARGRKPSPTPAPTPAPSTTAARMIFNETFINQKTLDSNWTTQSPFGQGLLSNATFGEQQVYVGSDGGYGNGSPFSFGPTGLTITATPIAASKRPALPPDAYPSNYQGPALACAYTSGCISTLGIHDFTPPFYAEFSIKSSPVPGLWLTAEFFGDPMTGFPEIDVAQLATKRPTQNSPDLFQNGQQTVNGGLIAIPGNPNLSAAFHTYGVELLSTGTNWYMDRKLSLASKKIVKGKLFATVNLACGDTWGADSADDFVGPPTGGGSITIGYVQVWDKRPF